MTQTVQYGREIQKFAVYFSNYQLLPYGRAAQLFEDLVGHRISEASLVSMNQRCADKLSGFITQLKGAISRQLVVHSYETEYYYNIARNWLHVLATEAYPL